MKPSPSLLKALGFALLLATTAQASAAPDEAVVREMARQTNISAESIRRDHDACDSGVTMSMKICAGYRWRLQDARLNAVYQKARDKARQMGYEASLVKAQRAWVAYRDAACANEGEMGAGGGSAQGLYELSCLEGLTKDRTQRIEDMLPS
jgi:uncharacterized protein YecT (DUF1311 family)